MKIIYKTGDLLTSSCRIIVHGCNAQGGMGSGVAKVIRAKYPVVYKEYRKKYDSEGLHLGEVIYAPVSDRRWIANGISQEYYGRNKKCYVSYEAINSIMTNVNSFAFQHGVTEVGMPLIGAGLGGGDFNIISKIIEECLTDTQPIVYTLDGNIPNN